jgi:flagellar biosynthesis component FlhA
MLKRVLLLSRSQDVERAQDQESEVEETLMEETCKVQMARGGVNSLFKNLQASLNNHVSIKDG